MAATTQQKRVMVVEDESAIRSMVSLALESEEYQVETADDGQDALNKIEEHTPDAILLDLMLPKVTGWAVIDWLSDNPGLGKVPIIALSAGARRVTVGEKGVKAFLSKPFDLDTLFVVLEDVLSSSDQQIAQTLR